ncbi:MAG: hypothetical protein ACREQC_00380, partial [Candidatus Binataceae bacterium]
MSWVWSFDLLSHVNMIALVMLGCASLLAVFFVFIFRQKRQAYLLAWAAGWLLIAIRFLTPAFTAGGIQHAWYRSANSWFLAAAAIAFYSSARLYARVNFQWRAVVASVAAAAIWAVAYSQGWVGAPLELGVALLFLLVARTFWQEAQKQESRAD